MPGAMYSGRLAKLGPGLGLRPWRIAAGISLGLACGVKWSGLYYVVAFGLLTVLWDVGARRTAGVATVSGGTAPRCTASIGLDRRLGIRRLHRELVGMALEYRRLDRQWAAGRGTDIRSFQRHCARCRHYHVEAWNFHTNLTTPHSYSANPWGWPLQARPTSFFYESPTGICGTDRSAGQRYSRSVTPSFGGLEWRR